jgi:hypothetical protein
MCQHIVVELSHIAVCGHRFSNYTALHDSRGEEVVFFQHFVADALKAYRQATCVQGCKELIHS